MMTPRTEKVISILALITITYLIEYMLLGKLFTHPNMYCFTMGGDGMQINFDIAYHAKHDTNYVLKAMNYPFYDSIFLTDAHGAIATLLQFFNRYIFDTSNYTIGIANGSTLYLVPLASIYTYLLLRKLKIQNALAVVAALYFTFLSPMIFRMIGGHFGMGFVFLLPYTFYTVLESIENWSYKRFLLYGVVASFFSLNNMYFSLLTLGFMGVAAAFFYMLHYNRKNAIKIFLFSFLFFLLCFAVISFTDYKTHRVKVPYGFWHFYNLDKVFFPQFGSVSLWMYKLIGVPHNNNAYAYAGYLALPIALVYVVKIIMGLVQQKKLISLFDNRALNILFIVSILFYLFALNYPFYLFRVFTQKYLYKLLQFRDSMRYAWPFSYMISLLVVYTINKYLQQTKNKFIVYGVLLFLGITWTIDIKSMYNLTSIQQNATENIFRTENKSNFTDEITNSVEYKKYQAIYVLPIVQLWTDKFTHDDELLVWNQALILSYKNKLPIINAKLSRMDLHEAHNCIQMVAHPLIHKSLLDSLPNKKPILLLHNLREPISQGEQYLKDKSKLLCITKDSVGLFELDITQSFDNSLSVALQKIKNQKSASVYEYINFEDTTAEYALDGKGAFSFDILNYFKSNREKKAVTIPLNKFKKGDWLEVSFWQYSHNLTCGNAEIKLKIFNGLASFEQFGTWQATTKDVYNHWIRGTHYFGVIDTQATLNVFVDNVKAYVDAILVKRIDDDVFFPVTKDSSVYNFNNYFIKVK